MYSDLHSILVLGHAVSTGYHYERTHTMGVGNKCLVTLEASLMKIIEKYGSIMFVYYTPAPLFSN